MKTVLECLVEDHLTTGNVTTRFEKAFASTFRYKQVISTNHLTSAYHLSLLALDVQAGDKVALSTFASVSALDAIFLLKATPVVIDLDKNSFHLNSEELTQKLADSSIKAIILDHSFGSVVDARRYDFKGIPVIEDISEVLGAQSATFIPGKQGSLAVCGLSVDQMITTGNGAMIITDQEPLAKKIRAMKTGKEPYQRKEGQPKLDYNLIDYQAALGIEQLSKIGIILERKEKSRKFIYSLSQELQLKLGMEIQI
ncbi:DegT/DnrJ/EryC1/StrS aminotransferase family protein [Leptospira interrogans serovar Pyrogenes str. 200701872]|uniref:DegT/DnrJ/EryC1/StrS aminotransferase family protein n=1 Tax=Leptospira interrogans serovar Pyrogenes str. 200701872 TaxID=1193029 RepID=M6ZVH2_LEPIR|nr:DegT/DnrJ/EryC1/StrS aminotransferase family protein [Leptospira interrogans serovar Pyrogenes str. 200701872]